MILGWIITIICSIGLIWIISKSWEYLLGMVLIAVILTPLAMMFGKLVN